MRAEQVQSLAGKGAVPFKSAGSGTETSLSAPGCQNTLGGCTVQTAGFATSSHLGSGPYVSTLTIDWAHYYPNGNGGFCAPASGYGTLTAANGDTLQQSETGIVCEVGVTGPNVPHTFTGSFTNGPGTGRFGDVSGTGAISGGDDGSGNSFYSETGNISY